MQTALDHLFPCVWTNPATHEFLNLIGASQSTGSQLAFHLGALCLQLISLRCVVSLSSSMIRQVLLFESLASELGRTSWGGSYAVLALPSSHLEDRTPRHPVVPKRRASTIFAQRSQ
jgi:hypothetical protein